MAREPTRQIIWERIRVRSPRGMRTEKRVWGYRTFYTRCEEDSTKLKQIGSVTAAKILERACAAEVKPRSKHTRRSRHKSSLNFSKAAL